MAKKLSQLQFSIARLHLKGLSQERLNIAYKVLVEGYKGVDIASEYGVSKQSVGNTCARVIEAYEFDCELQEARQQLGGTVHISNEPIEEGVIIPKGWNKVTLVAPQNLIDSFSEQINNSIKQT